MTLSMYLSMFGDTILGLLVRHVLLFLAAFVASGLLGFLLGIMAYRARSQRVIVQAINVLQATPEVVLLAIAIPFLGIGYFGALVPLFVKGVLPVLQNTMSGLRSVDPSLREAARGMGMTERQVFLRVELITAAPAVVGGLRVSAVMLMSVITLTAYIGVESLGTLILQGIARMDANALLIGSGLAALLAVIANQLLVVGERIARRKVGLSG